MNKIIISILTYGKISFTQKCLESLFASPNFSDHQIVVSDNGSTDGTQKWLQTLGKRIRFVNNGENLGFSKAHNKIINTYPENDVVILNNDLQVPEYWLDKLVNFSDENNLGAASPAIKNINGLDVGAVLDDHAKGRSLISSKQTPDWITGSCMYIKRSTINKIGLLDEDYKFYYEDVDYCFRMKKANIKFACNHDVAIIHHGSASSTSSTKKIIMEDSRKRFCKKWGYKE